MNPEQISQLLNLLERIAARNYTLTGAADWPILVAVGGLLIGIIGMMWADLRTSIKESRREWQEAMKEHRVENEKNSNILWEALRHCQDDCCPPRGNNRDR